MNGAFDNLHNALEQLWESIYDAFTVRVWGGRLALWQVLIAVDLFLLAIAVIAHFVGVLR